MLFPDAREPNYSRKKTVGWALWHRRILALFRVSMSFSRMAGSFCYVCTTGIILSNYVWWKRFFEFVSPNHLVRLLVSSHLRRSKETLQFSHYTTFMNSDKPVGQAVREKSSSPGRWRDVAPWNRKSRRHYESKTSENGRSKLQKEERRKLIGIMETWLAAK